MRICLLLLSLVASAFALEPEDLHGMWRGSVEGDASSAIEMFYGTDGKLEMRMTAVFIGIEFKMQGFGTWTVKGDTVYGRSTGGWVQFGEDPPEPLDEDPEPVGEKATLVPGNPRKIQIEDCEEGDCTIQELSYVGATKTFTLPVVGPGASIRAAKAVLEPGKPRNGRLAMRVLRDGRAFDLMGRPAR
jgi:hypothetical protein